MYNQIIKGKGDNIMKPQQNYCPEMDVDNVQEIKMINWNWIDNTIIIRHDFSKSVENNFKKICPLVKFKSSLDIELVDIVKKMRDGFKPNEKINKTIKTVGADLIVSYPTMLDDLDICVFYKRCHTNKELHRIVYSIFYNINTKSMIVYFSQFYTHLLKNPHDMEYYIQGLVKTEFDLIKIDTRKFYENLKQDGYEYVRYEYFII
jgi:hypothetical protein